VADNGVLCRNHNAVDTLRTQTLPRLEAGFFQGFFKCKLKTAGSIAGQGNGMNGETGGFGRFGRRRSKRALPRIVQTHIDFALQLLLLLPASHFLTSGFAFFNGIGKCSLKRKGCQNS
jgi:hypothetical protein